MAVQNTDLLLVQRGNVPFRETAQNISNFVTTEISNGNVTPPIASAAQLGVIRVGNNLAIDGNGILEAVIPAGLEFQGVWVDAANPPTGANNGDFWVWDGGNATLTNALWGNANNTPVSDGDRIFFDGTTFDVVPGGGGGIIGITGTAPITVDNSNPDRPDIEIDPATTTDAGSMSAADKLKLDGIDAGAEVNVGTDLGIGTVTDTTMEVESSTGRNVTLTQVNTVNAGLMSSADKILLDNLVTSPGGVQSVSAGDGITVAGTAAVPVVSVTFGSAPNGTPTTVMPYDISMLGDLP